MTPIELKFLLWGVGILIAILGFISVFLLNRATKALDRLGEDVNEMKNEMVKLNGKHELQENINEQFEKRIEKLEEAI